MKVLHTSDWHLGVSTGPVSRLDEQRSFLDWLLVLLEDRRVDALIVAGDVFDTMQPSSEALATYYRFLARVGHAGVRDIVIVGGNHDSPSHLDAPRTVLKAVGVHVIGGIPANDDRLERMTVALRSRGSDDVAAVCLAVPYVHEYKLGIRTTDLDRAATRSEFRSAFGDLYRKLADAADAQFPAVRLVATGHLTLGTGSSRQDYPQEIHQVGTIEGLPTDILDRRVRYTALGHIHRCYPVAETSAWYSGSPIAYSLTEMQIPRHVLMVDLASDGSPGVEKIEVPSQRSLVELVGSADEVTAAIRSLAWATPLPPLVHARVDTAIADSGLTPRLHEALATHEEARRPVLVDVQQRRPPGALLALPAPRFIDRLDDPARVFALLCDARGISPEEREPLVAGFAELAAANTETFREMLDAIDDRPDEGGDAL